MLFATLLGIPRLAVFIPAYLLIINKQFNELHDLDNNINSLIEAKSQAASISSEEIIDKYRAQTEEVRSQFRKFVIPSKDNIQTLASIEIDKISHEIGLEEFHIDPWSSSEIAAFGECKYLFGQPMEVSFKATFNEFAKFLNMLERYKTVIFIDTFSITRSTGEDVKHQVRMALAVLVERPSSSAESSG